MNSDEHADPEEPEPSPNDLLRVDVIWDEAIRIETPIDSRVSDAVRQAAASQGFYSGQIGVRVASDSAIHEVNAKFLAHDYPTDVISFGYEQDGEHVEGELIVSLDRAREQAAQFECSEIEELLLYVAHGTLHICGLDDQTDEDRAEMRQAERMVLAGLGIEIGHSVPSMEVVE